MPARFQRGTARRIRDTGVALAEAPAPSGRRRAVGCRRTDLAALKHLRARRRGYPARFLEWVRRNSLRSNGGTSRDTGAAKERRYLEGVIRTNRDRRNPCERITSTKAVLRSASGAAFGLKVRRTLCRVPRRPRVSWNGRRRLRRVRGRSARQPDIPEQAAPEAAAMFGEERIKGRISAVHADKGRLPCRT